MFRYLGNILKGRERVLNEKIDEREVLKILGKLNKNVEISLWYYPIFFTVTTPNKIANIIKKDFNTDDRRHYCQGIHQIFSREKEEKHYIGLDREQFREARYFDGVEYPNSLSLEFVVQK